MKHIFLSIIPPSNLESQVFRIKRALFSRFHLIRALSLPPLVPLLSLEQEIDKSGCSRAPLDSGLPIMSGEELVFKNNNLYLPLSPGDFIDPSGLCLPEVVKEKPLFPFFPGILVAQDVSQVRGVVDEINRFLTGRGLLISQRGKTYTLGCFAAEFSGKTDWDHLDWAQIWSLKKRGKK